MGTAAYLDEEKVITQFPAWNRLHKQLGRSLPGEISRCEGFMSYRNKTYVIFDGDNDMYAYRFMRGWRALEHLDFDFHDAHEVGCELTDRACEETVKRRLRERFSSAKQVIVLVGPNTRFLYRFVRWEIQVALDLGLPIIVVNLNGRLRYDDERCPPILKNQFAVHVPFKMKAIQFAMDHFPDQHRRSGSISPPAPVGYSTQQYVIMGVLASSASAQRV